MSRWIAVGLAVTLLLAGCQGAPEPGVTESSIDSPGMATATEQQSTTGPSTFSYPAGTSPEGIDPSRLPATHTAALVDAQRYTLTLSQTAGNQTLTTRLHVDHGRQRVLGERTLDGGGNRTVDIYTTGDTVYRRQSRQLTDESAFVNYEERSQNWSSAGLTANETLAGILEAYQFDVDAVTSRNGSRVVRYRSTGPRENGANGPGRASATGEATLEIDEQGIVRSLVVRLRDGGRFAFTVHDAEADIVRPEWVDDAAGPPPLELPAANLTANTTTVELLTANDTLETTAVWIHHEGGDSMNASALDVTANRARAYDVRRLATTNETLTPTKPFDDVGETFDPGESIRIVHTISPRLYGGAVSIADGHVAIANRSGNRSFPSLQDDRSIQPGQQVHVLWNRSRPQTLLTYTVEPAGKNRSVTSED
jgi:hypothetical protein